MRRDHANAWLLGALLVGFVVGAAPASYGQSCLTGAQSTEKATTGEVDYVYSSSGHAVDARGVTWLNIADHALFLDGSASGCWSGGRVDGPYGEESTVYYECSSEHGFTGGTCLPYHTTAGMAPDGGPRVIEDVHIKDYGDGISVESASGDIAARRIWFQNIHDDALESDYAQQSLSCVDCLFEKTNMVLAFDRRSSADGNTPKSGWTGELRNSLVQLYQHVHTYKEKPGHGGVIKDDPSVAPNFRFTDNVFLMGPVAGSGQVQFPLINKTTECRGNTLLWEGTQAAYNSMLSTGDSSDGATNGERLSWLNSQYSNCYTVIVKPASQSAADFRAQRWDPLVRQWKASHAAAGGTPSPSPSPAPSPAPAPAPTPTPGPSAPPQEPILLP